MVLHDASRYAHGGGSLMTVCYRESDRKSLYVIRSVLVSPPILGPYDGYSRNLSLETAFPSERSVTFKFHLSFIHFLCLTGIIRKQEM